MDSASQWNWKVMVQKIWPGKHVFFQTVRKIAAFEIFYNLLVQDDLISELRT